MRRQFVDTIAITKINKIAESPKLEAMEKIARDLGPTNLNETSPSWTSTNAGFSQHGYV